MKPVIDLNINIAGTQERADAMNAKLIEDLRITNNRPFLNKDEKIEFAQYFSDWATNHLIALLNFDREGNYLPDAYSAPQDILRLLYPIDDLVQFDRQGTIIIDREQYTPALKNISFFIYIVDQELYDEYFDKQKYNIERNSRPYMWDFHNNNGVRVFKNYFELARHLRKQRLVTYILGPRAMFYMRFYLHQIHVHTIDNDYAFGRKFDGTLVRDTVEHIRETLAYQIERKQTYKVKIKDDDYTLVRVLASKYQMNLPDIKEYNNTTDIVRYSKLRLGQGRPMTIKKNKLTYYTDKYGIQPYHSCTSCAGYWIFFIWDTRKIEAVLPLDSVNDNDLCQVKWDNGFDLAIDYDPAKQEMWDICQSLKHKLAIQFRNMNLTNKL